MNDDAQAGAPGDARTVVARVSDREATVTRTFDAPAHLVFRAWSDPELFASWWIPQASGVYFVSREADIRTGGGYRFLMGHPSMPQPMAFHGRYLEVTPPSRIVWTNEEGAEGGQVTTVTFEERDGRTRVVLHELYPSKAALDAAVADQSMGGYGESFTQLDALLASLDAEAG